MAANGFTLIELMVVLAVLGIVLSLAIPSLNAFVSRSQSSALASEFAAAVMQARMEAITRNGCVTICQSTNTTSGAPSCASSGDDWHRGWISFYNPTCNTTQTSPTSNSGVLLKVRTPPDSSYYLINNNGDAVRRIMFDGRGFAGMGALFSYTQSREPEGGAWEYAKHICISQGGRVTVRKYEGGDAC